MTRETLAAQWDSRANMPRFVGSVTYNGGGNDERPTASTADRSSRSDSRKRKEGVAHMVATLKLSVTPSPENGSVR